MRCSRCKHFKPLEGFKTCKRCLEYSRMKSAEKKKEKKVYGDDYKKCNSCKVNRKIEEFDDKKSCKKCRGKYYKKKYKDVDEKTIEYYKKKFNGFCSGCGAVKKYDDFYIKKNGDIYKTCIKCIDYRRGRCEN